MSDLPHWYDLNKYSKAKELNCLQWYWQLATRLELHFFVAWALPKDHYDELPNDDLSKQSYAQSRQLLEAIRNDPVPDSAALALGVERPIFPLRGGVEFALLSDIDNQLFWMDVEDQERARKYLGRSDPSSCDAVPDPLFQLKDDSSGEALLSVNLNIPERLLLENFTALVRGAKKKQVESLSEISRYRKPDFNEWTRVGLLPYLDLKIFEMQEEVSIPNRVLADAIFSGDEEGEEVVRKTTSKLAERVLNGELIKVLATLHASEDV